MPFEKLTDDDQDTREARDAENGEEAGSTLGPCFDWPWPEVIEGRRRASVEIEATGCGNKASGAARPRAGWPTLA